MFHRDSGMFRAMTDWRDIIRKTLKERGLNMKQVSLAAGLGETAVRDMLDKVASPRIDTVEAVAEQLGYTLAELLSGAQPSRQTIPVIGYVSAGEGWHPFDGDAPIDQIEMSMAGGSAIALVVRGASMMPVYRDGDTLIGTKRATTNATSLIGKDCIVQTSSGDRYVKYIAKGATRGRFNLKSYNPAHADVENVQIDWAAPISIVLRG